MCDGHSDVRVDLGHKVVGVDGCIAPLVTLLNDHGYTTVASCCGHGTQPTTVILEDDRWLLISRDRADGEAMLDVFKTRWLADRVSKLEDALTELRRSSGHEHVDALVAPESGAEA